MRRRRSEEEIEALMEAEREYKERLLSEVRCKIEELKQEVPASFQKEARIAYLKDRMSAAIVRAWDLMTAYEDYFQRDRIVERLLVAEELEALLKKILKLQRDIRGLMPKGLPEQGRDAVTREMIDYAREYPFTELYEFKRNTARCPFHDDRTPSLALMKDNRVHCFGACNKSWDTIAFLMNREGLTFLEAVRRLQ